MASHSTQHCWHTRVLCSGYLQRHLLKQTPTLPDLSSQGRLELKGTSGTCRPALRDEGDTPLLQNQCTVAGLACNHSASFSKKLLNERLARVSTAGGESWEPSTATFFAVRYLGFLHTRLSIAVPQLDNGVLTCGKTL